MNRIFPEQLNHHLAQSLARVYLLQGQDPLLLSETEDTLCQVANQQGFDEKNTIQVDSQTDWAQLIESCQSIGLFFSKQILSLNLPENFTALLQKNLQELISVLHKDVLLILQVAKLAKGIEKQTWFITLNQYEPNTILINCQTPTVENLPRWVKNRTKAMGLDADNEAIQQLCYSYENNLLALKQALQLLDLLYPDHKLNYNRVISVVEQSSIFTPFQWIDALLMGKANRAKRILKGLQAEDVQPVILLRTLQRELFTLLELTKPQQCIVTTEKLPTQQIKTEFDRLKIWQNRRPLFLSAIQRLTYQTLYEIIQELANIERLTKQEFSDEVWIKLADLSVKICL
ncbi:TPA: DNA polymerase III subunit delta [Haemophilus influenzae]|uniref:DNA polymerase III subunit delta n=1 Tax=Haemophilus influenzae TaxID=727 RepID=UPI000665C150|nr:DNA polymerase III subunit delta [Haemophilus influenzae]KMZ18434.1 DNA polymerase III subunit delta [Haemophilus influenzae]PRJ05296.1 DNA polymerase III subunit delta [Haemophilus influenzae]PRJ53212.1 DNA polymerase III subunit delta [Haemophilus influenzae]PRK85455.1 DNA polymerase III subunit delta [Haemophilus influenzae]PRK90200.1 DNA polymerase III subunit delta [Haemophilus influenzae]